MESIVKKILVLSGFILGILLTGNTYAAYAFWELPDTQLPYVAMVRADPHWGHAVIYNPDLCKQVGDACAFFRAHEFAHVKLNHTLLSSPESYPASQVRGADCWAARNVKPKEVVAAVKLLTEIENYPSIRISGNPALRAQRVSDCAIEAGNWTGNY